MNDSNLRRDLVISCASLAETRSTWWRRELAIYARHGEEVYLNGNGRDKPTPHAMMRVLGLLLSRDFAVNATGTDFKHKPNEVDDEGFRPYFIADIMRKTLLMSEDTVRRALSFWEKAGVITRRRPGMDTTGKYGFAKYRLNPGALVQISECIIRCAALIKSRVEAAIICRKSRRMPMAHPRIDSALSYSSIPQSAAPPVADSVAVPPKESDITPPRAEVGNLFSGGQNVPESRPSLSDNNFEKIIGILATQYPDVTSLTFQQRKQLRSLTNNIFPRHRLTVEMAELLVRAKQWDDERVAPSLGKTQGILEGFHRFDTFMELVPFWKTHLARIVRNYGLKEFDQAVESNGSFCRSTEMILSDASMREVCAYAHTCPEVTTLRFLIEGLSKRWGAALVASFADRCQKFLLTRPYLYAIAVAKCPQIQRACEIDDYDHQRLIREYRADQDKIAVWQATSWRHGFQS